MTAGLAVQAHQDPPRLDDFVRVGGPEHQQARHGAERGELLDRLVGRPVLADADRVVREDVHDGDLHQRREPDRPSRVVGEDQEARPVRAQLRQRHAVRDRGRRVLADPEVEVASAAALGLEVARAVERQVRLRRRRQVGRAADDPRHCLRDGVEHPARRVAARETLLVGGERRQRALPARRELAALDALELVGQVRVLRAVLLEHGVPYVARLAPARADAGCEVVVHAVGDEEVLVLGHAEEPLRRLAALDPERLAVRLRRVLDRRAVTDVAVDEDQRRALVLGLERVERPRDRVEVVRVGDGRDVPAVRHEPGRDILGERDVGVPLDRHAVGVVDPAQVREALVRCERRRLRGDAFHHAAVPSEGVDVEVEDREAVAVVASSRATVLRSPCPPTSRRPGRAGRSSSRRRSSTGTRDDRGTSSRADGTS